jgi:protease I
MKNTLKNKKVAIVATNGFEEVELTQPREALEKAGAETYLISPEEGKIKAWDHTDWGGEYEVDVLLNAADPKDYDALLLPGGVMNPDHLRKDEKVVKFVREFFKAGKPVAAICHGPQVLIETNILKGRTLTSYPSVKTDLINAGAHWVDEEVVVDKGLVTSRKPDDIPVFNEQMIKLFSDEGYHEKKEYAVVDENMRENNP